jgi:hypothetical protein
MTKNYSLSMARKIYQDKNKLVWLKLSDYNYPRRAIYLPEKYRKEVLCRVYERIFGRHNTTVKTYIKIS